MGISLGYLGDILGVSWIFFRDIFGISPRHLWISAGCLGISGGYRAGFLGHILGISCGYLRDICGISWAYLGDILHAKSLSAKGARAERQRRKALAPKAQSVSAEGAKR